MVDEDSCGTDRSARSLKTAASVLRALRLLGGHPEGLSCQDLGEHLGKSPATARYMINTLWEAGYAERGSSGRWCLAEAPPWGTWTPDDAAAAGTGVHGSGSDGRAGAAGTDVGRGDPEPQAVLAEAVTELYRRTRQRSYLVRRSGVVVATVSDVRGHQGLARHPGLADHVPPHHAHALAMTKVLLAASPAYFEAVEGEPLLALTSATLSDADALRHEIDGVRRRGHAVDAEEYAAGFCTVAAPVVSPLGDVTVALGLSTSARRHGADGDALAKVVVEVAEEAGRQWTSAVSAPRR